MLQIGKPIMTTGYLGIFREHFPGPLALAEANTHFSRLIERHVHGDYGDVDEEDKEHNASGTGSVFSKYYIELGKDEYCVYVVTVEKSELTEATTTIMLLDEW